LVPPGLHKIGEVASQLATSVRAIRYYEEEGLITPIRTEAGTRWYADAHVQRLRAILSLARNGFSIESIRLICHLREQCLTGRESSQRLSSLLEESLRTLDAQIQSLGALRDEIASAQTVIASCGHCDNHPSTRGCPKCPVISKLSEISLLNLIWDTDA
jgi:DNA-binding transcriptional MerR regulator